MAKDVLFEIGLEELPARFIDSAEMQLRSKTEKWLNDLRISFESITSFSTPRRLAVVIKNVAEFQATVEVEVKGPAVKIAKDENGNWTKAAIGFTKGQGKTVDDIYIKELNGTPYIYVKKYIEGKPVIDLLPEFKEIITSIQFGKNMRWGTESVKYARPIRWLVALYGKEIIPFEIAHVATGNVTQGHRFLGSKITVKTPLAYESALKEQYVIVDPKERERLILKGIKREEEKGNFHIPVDKDLLEEVRNLVEYPTVFVGSFEEPFLKLPEEVLITSMKEHQRYFPVKSADGELLAHFVGVRNGDSYGLETVIKGNEKVLRARLSDAVFFYEEDQKNSIEFYLGKLNRVVFQEKLGTYSEKVDRIVQITKELAAKLDVGNETTENAIRAAEICKFDLMTNMVNEFTELQGIMGEKYANIFGEQPITAQAIREHYLPEHSHGKLPETVAGSLVSVADKLDTIVGCISVGLIPTGSQDPYGLRRQAMGVLRIVKNEKWDISVESLFRIPLNIYQNLDIEKADQKKTKNELQEFLKLRASYLLKENEVEQDVIQAVLDNEIGIFDYTMDKAKIISEKRNDPAFKPIEEALIRVLNLTGKTDQTDINIERFETASEKTLYETYLSVEDDYNRSNKEKNAEKSISLLAKLADPIHDFFDHNMVMAEDESVRNNRLALVNRIGTLITEFANLKLVEWKQHF